MKLERRSFIESTVNVNGNLDTQQNGLQNGGAAPSSAHNLLQSFLSVKNSLILSLSSGVMEICMGHPPILFSFVTLNCVPMEAILKTGSKTDSLIFDVMPFKYSYKTNKYFTAEISNRTATRLRSTDGCVR